MYMQQLEKRLVIINISFCIEAGAMAPSNGVGLVPNHRHVNTTLTGGIYRMVQPNSSTRWAFEIPSSVVRNRLIARVRHHTHRVLYSSMVAALANFYLVTAFFWSTSKEAPGDKHRMAGTAHRSWDGEHHAQLSYCTAVVRSG